MKKTLLLSICLSLLFSASNAAGSIEQPSLIAREIARKVSEKYEKDIVSIQSGIKTKTEAYETMGSHPFSLEDGKAIVDYFAGYLWLVQHNVRVSDEEKAIVETYQNRKSTSTAGLNVDRPLTQKAFVGDTPPPVDYSRERSDHTEDKGLRTHLRSTGTFDPTRDQANKQHGQAKRIKEKNAGNGLAAREFRQSQPGASEHQPRKK